MLGKQLIFNKYHLFGHHDVNFMLGIGLNIQLMEKQTVANCGIDIAQSGLSKHLEFLTCIFHSINFELNAAILTRNC